MRPQKHVVPWVWDFLIRVDLMSVNNSIYLETD